ncbi:MAG TPA: Maf family protein, partial [Leptolinea sp.]
LQLRGHIHQVMTAIGLLDPVSNLLEQELCCTDVQMRDYSDAEITTYVASGNPLDKAGAYAIQHTGFHPVENFCGCFASVMGLPLCHLKRMAAKKNLPAAQNMAEKCQQINNYACPIFQQVEAGYEIG